MEHADLTQSDIEKIEKWERIYKATNRKTFTIVEASAFMIDWHPAAYLNDRRKNLIATVAERIKATLITNWEGDPCSLEGEFPTKVGGVDSYSKLAYYRWAKENYPQTDKTIDDLEWFKTIKKLSLNTANKKFSIYPKQGLNLLTMVLKSGITGRIKTLTRPRKWPI